MRLFPKTKKGWPVYIAVLAGALLSNAFAYNGAKLIVMILNLDHYHIDTTWDRAIPTLPWTVLIYFGCFVLWGINYCFIANYEPQERDRFFCADIFAKLICFVIFVIFPTTANIRTAIPADSNFFNLAMRLLYWIDTPYNLFPSIHCLTSWLCWVGIRKRKDVPLLYKWFTFIAAIAVCIATLTTRQHVLIDVFSGILLAELCYYLSKFSKIRSVYSNSLSFILKKLKKKK